MKNKDLQAVRRNIKPIQKRLKLRLLVTYWSEETRIQGYLTQ